MTFLQEYEALCKKYGVFIDATCYYSVALVPIQDVLSTTGGFEETLKDLASYEEEMNK